MMIRAPDVNQFLKMPLELVPMVCDIGGEVSKLAVAFDDRAIFVVAKLRRSVPLGAVLRIEQAARAQFVHRAIDLVALTHDFFAEERIEFNTEILQLRANRVQ